MEGADIYQIAKNCRTSVEMIEKYYAAHIKTRLDAAAINVMRPHRFKNKTGNKARTKFQASPATSDHNLRNLGNLAPRRRPAMQNHSSLGDLSNWDPRLARRKM
jgi:hypothetical protein